MTKEKDSTHAYFVVETDYKNKKGEYPVPSHLQI